ncbi:MAG TPA: ABC transporter permease [Nocardioidaceae bacterium]|nr:ABC transporter permease [Nocardioidaceae bacterium]
MTAAVGRPPLRLLVLAGLAVLFLVIPLVGLIARSPWQSLPRIITEPDARDALVLSLLTSGAAILLCLVFGLPLAWVLGRVEFRGRSLLRALVTVPLVLPPVVAGVALLAAFGRKGVVGGPLYDWFDITLPFTTLAVVLAHTFVALPFFVISVEGSLRASAQEYDVVAAVLGASRWHTFTRVTVPMTLPGITAGMILGFARSLGEFGATITFAGNYPGSTQTMPLLTYVELQRDPQAAYALSLVMLVISLVILALLRERWIGQGVSR